MYNRRNNEEIIELTENIDNSIEGIIDLIYAYSESKNVDIDYANKTILSLMKNTKTATERLLTRLLVKETTDGNKN